MIVIMVTITVAMVLACVGILTSDSILFRKTLERDLSALARITADNSTASVVFNDSRTATVTLNALRARAHLVKACIYRLDGSILARYLRNGEADAWAGPGNLRCTPFGSETDEAIFWGNCSGRQTSRNLDSALRYGQQEKVRRRLFQAIYSAVLLLSSLIAFLLSSGLRARIADPISWLSRCLDGRIGNQRLQHPGAKGFRR